MESYLFFKELLLKFELAPIGDNIYYLAIVIIVAFGLLSQVLLILFKTLTKSLAKRIKIVPAEQVIEIIQWPVIYTVLFWGIGNAIVSLQLKPFLELVFLRLTITLIAFNIVYAVYGIFKAILQEFSQRFSHERHTNIHKEILPFIIGTAKVVAVSWTILWVLSIWTINIIPYLVGIAIIAVIIGMAIKDTLANIIAGVVVLLDENINIGDHIEFEDKWAGEIIDIGLRVSKIKTNDNKIIIIPNHIVINTVIKK